MADLDYIRELIDRQQRELLHMHDTVTIIENLTGYSLDELLEKLAAGYTLQPPKEPYKFSDLLRAFGD